MNFKEHNISAMAEYFASGCKAEKLLGLELEHFVVDKKSRLSLPYENGVELILKRLQPIYGDPILSEPGPEGRIIGISRLGADITLEPAAQLEISAGPAQQPDELAKIYDEFIELITPILDDMGCELECVGYHPKSKIDDLPMIPKPRYGHMRRYFNTSGNRGKYMMKGSAATQISIDYHNEADFSKKFRVANILSPIFAFACDNAKVFEGEPSGGMVRTYIWNDVDPVRSLIAKGALDKPNFGFYDYAKYVYEVPPIFLIKNGVPVYTGSTPSSELFASEKVSQEDIEHMTSLVFPDVRIKTTIEIRTMDSMPIKKALAFVELIRKIFYDEQNLDKFYQTTLDIRNHDVAEAKEALLKNGVHAQVYNKHVKEWLDILEKVGK